jgi:hypothetical protein
MHSICHVSKGEKDGDFSTMIPPKRNAFVKVKASLSSFGNIECCLVYELIDQRNEHKPIMGDHQVFIAVRVFAMPFFSNYEASSVIFMAEKGQFTGRQDDMKRLKKMILQKCLIDNEYSFICDINGRTLRLKTLFHPGRQANIEVTLEEIVEHVDNGPVPFE